MKFAITTKSGRSIIYKADDYKDAQKYADTHYGKGCIVQVVGNKSCNSVVSNAIEALHR